MVRSYIPAPRPIDIIYAPIDLAVATAKGLGKKGHQVTLFSPLGTVVSGENVTVETLNMRSLVNNQEEFNTLINHTDVWMHDIPGLWDRYMSSAMFERAAKGEFDVLIFHHPEVALSGARYYTKVPTLHVLHDPIYSYYKEVFELCRSDNQRYVSISNNQRRDAPDLPYAGTIYNGTDTSLFTFSEEAEDYLLFTGRITPEKGVKEAIQVARESKHRLLIIGPVDTPCRGYFDQYINPELDDKILYLGRVDQDRLPKYYQKAKALLTPVQWEEPFGLTTIEAMACGTPVISLSRGAAPELIDHGKTGFVVGSVNDMVGAVGKLDTIKRSDCRKHVEENFSISNMVDAYERVLHEIVPQKPTKLLQKDAPIQKQLRKLKDILTS